MASKQDLTVFQRLNRITTPNGIEPEKASSNKYNIGDGELLRTTSQEEYKTRALQAKQNKYLGLVWGKVEDNLFQQSIQYEMTRIGAYSDFENMEFYPEIAATLDILMEESTTVNDVGRVLNIYSDSPRVKGILEDLFFNRMDIHTTLPMWVRNMPIREDSIIPLLDGTEVTIKELSNKIKDGEEVWSYAVQDNTKAIVPSKITWCDLTRRNSELIRITLDDGTYVDTTPDHEYMLRDGSYKRADELISGQSLMPFYTRKSDKKKDCINGYEKVYNPSTTKYKFTHSMVAHECVRDLGYEKRVGGQFDTHHQDFNKLNNKPTNLVRLTHSDHFKLHIEHFNKVLGSPEVVKKRMEGIDRYLRSDERRQRLSNEMSGVYPKDFEEYNSSNLHSEHNIVRSEKMLNNWSDTEFREKTKKGMTIEISDSCLDYISNITKNTEGYIGAKKLAELLKYDNKFIALFKETYTIRKDITKSINPTTLKKTIFRKTNKNYFDFVLSVRPNLILDKNYVKAKAIYLGKTKEKSLLNHKVVSVVKLNETSDVYCLEAVGPNGEHDRHNFPVCGKDINGNYSRNSGVFLSNCKYGDNFVYLNITDTKGIISAKQLPNFEMERREGGVYDTITAKLNSTKIDTDQREKAGKEEKVRFFWRGRDLEFQAWQIAHFRLLGDDRRLPYGTSVLEKARRIWKQLLLSEDAMLVYRVTRAPERRVFKVYVGNIDVEDVQAYVNDIANNFKRASVVDSQTGQIDLRFNQLANDQDIFIPVRDENAATPIDTLPGAQNLDQIADIEYLQRKLFTSLRVPKSFLGFDDPVGDGKNLALMDIRFARTINRLQQAIIQELNKMAIIHLYLLGFDDDLDNFTITMNNPSTQAKMLRIENLQQQFTAIQTAVADAGNGFGIMSMTRARREILGWSNEEIKQDLLEQRMEKAAAAELANTASVIKNTKLFDKVDKLYGDIDVAREGGQTGEEGEDGGPAGGGGGFGGGGMGGEDIDFGDEDVNIEDEGGAGGDIGGDMGGEDLGGEGDAGGDDLGGDIPEMGEDIKLVGKLLREEKIVLTEQLVKVKDKRNDIWMNRLMESLVDKKDQTINENKVKMTDRGLRINDDIDGVLRNIDKLLDKDKGNA